MSDQEQQDKLEIIAGIEQDARTEAENLLTQAREYIKERREACARKVAAIKQEAEEKLAQQVEEIRKTSVSSIKVEKRRISLRVRDKIISGVSSEVRKYLASLCTAPQYTEILQGWILEAAIGLNAPKAVVNASAAERGLITPDLLQEVTAGVKKLAGLDIELSLADAPPLQKQGVVVTAADGRTAFNNQVQTRLLRYQSEIRKMIYDTLFKDEL